MKTLNVKNIFGRKTKVVLESQGGDGVTKVSALPESGVAGRIYYNTADGKYYVYNETTSVFTELGVTVNPSDIMPTVEQTTSTSQSGGDNIITFTFPNGNKTQVIIKNGAQGAQGNSGVASADGIESVNNLNGGTTDTAEKVYVLGANMGKELKDELDTKVGVVAADKNIINQPLVNKIVQPTEYTKVDGSYIRYATGAVIASDGQSYIRIDASDFRGSTLKIFHINNTLGYAIGYSSFDSQDTRLDGGYYGPTNDNTTYTININSSASYLLISVGATASFNNIQMVWDLSYIPDEIYTLKSLGGKDFAAKDVNFLSYADKVLLTSGISNRLNQLNKDSILDGYKLDMTTQTIIPASGYGVVLQPIPIGTTNILMYGYKGSGAYTYFPYAVLDNGLNVLNFQSPFGNVAQAWFIDLSNISGAKYFAFNAYGSDVGNSIDDVVLMFDVELDYASDIDYFVSKKDEIVQSHNVVNETLPKNLLSYDYLTAVDANYSTFTLDFQTNGEAYLVWLLPDGEIQNTNGSFIQYDENDNVLLSETMFSCTNRVNFGKNINKYGMIRLQSGCAKIRLIPNLGLTKRSLRYMVERGNMVFLTNDRVVYRRKPRVLSIDGVNLNQTCKTPLEGKIIACFGDSITDFGSSGANGASWADGGYPWYIQKRYECACINYGRGNAHFCDVANTDPTADENPGTGKTSEVSGYNNVVSTQVRWFIAEMQNAGLTPDAVILGGGTNDCFADVNYGNLSTAMSAYPITTDAVHTDYYGCVVYMVSKLRAAFPNIKIFLSTPIRSLNSTQMARLNGWCEAVHNAATALGCEVIDFYNESGIIEYPTTDNPMFATDDPLHPSQLGVDAMGRLAASKLIAALS